MTAYAIARLQDAPPTVEIADYMDRILGTLEPHGGRFLVHGTRHDVVEGEWTGNVVVIGFPGMAEARAWWDSAEYREIAPLRARHIPTDIILVEGVPEGYDPAPLAQQVREAASAT